MSKKFKSQASSARAASTAFGSSSSFGFGNSTSFQTTTSLLSYVNEQPDLSAISQPNIVVAFKNLSKKDSTTKEKALDELNGYLSADSAGDGFVVEDAVIEAWTNIYPRTSIDNSRRVRQSAHTFQGSLTSLSGKKIAPHLPKIIGPWLAGTFDQDRAVARSASEALLKSFTTVEKRKSLWKLYRKALVDYVEDALTVQTAQTLSDERTTTPDDAEAKYIRVVATAFSVFTATLLAEVDGQASGNVDEAIRNLLRSTKLWEHAYHSDPTVRRACYTLLMNCLVKRADQLDWKVISSSFLGKGLHTNQLGSTGQYSEAILEISRIHPESWTTGYTSKTPASKRILRFIERGSQRGPAVFWTNLAHLLETIPREVWNQGNEDPMASQELDTRNAKLILESYRTGISSAEEPRQNLRAAWESYMELSIWICEQLPEDDGKGMIIKEHVLPVIQQYLNQDSHSSGFAIPTPIASVICVGALSKIATKFGLKILEDFWKNSATDLLEAVKISQPEQSSTFKTSQDQVSVHGQRFFELATGFLDTVEESLSVSCEESVCLPIKVLVEQCINILNSRVGKPYGAASIIKDAIATLTPARSPKFGLNVRELLLSFLEDKIQDIADSPSAGILISLLLRLRVDPTVSEKANRIVERLLASDELDPTKPAIQSLVLNMAPDDLDNYPNVRQSLLHQLDNAIAGKESTWTTTTAILRHQPADSAIKEEFLSRMLSSLSIDTEAQNSIRGFENLLESDSKMSMEQTIGSVNTSNLLSKLLVLEEMPDETLSEAAHNLADRIRDNLKKAGLATKATLEIVRQQLSLTGEQALSIHTVIDLAREAFTTKFKSEDAGFQDIYPDEAEWQSAVDPLLQSCPPRSVAITSPLRGAALLVKSNEAQLEVTHDASGFSAAVRLAMFTTKLTQATTALGLADPARQRALFLYLPVTLQIINEKLDISNANDSWTAETQEVEDEMILLVTDGRNVLADLIAQQTQHGSLDTLPSDPTVESCWLMQLTSISDNLPKSFRLAVSSAEMLSICVDRAGINRYAQVLTDLIANIRKSSNTFQSAVLVEVCKAGLIPTKRLSTEFIIEVTETSRMDQASPDLGTLVVLNLLLDGEADILTSLPTQRLVYLVKAVVQAVRSSDHSTEELCEMMKLLTLVLPNISSIYDEFWNDLWLFVASAIKRDWTVPVALPLLQSTLKLFLIYKDLAAAEANDDLIEVWQEHEKELPILLLEPLTQYGKPGNGAQSGLTHPTDESSLHFVRNRPGSIVMNLLGRLLTELPVNLIEDSEELFPLLNASEREVQSTIFDILHRNITDHQEQVSLDVALSKETAHLPTGLLSLLVDAPDYEAILRSTQLSDAKWIGPLRYLLAWKLVFDHFTKASHKLREMYADDIKASGQLGTLLGFVCELLSVTTARPFDTSRDSVDDFDFKQYKNEPQYDEAQALSAHLYYLSLLYLPNLTRTWWFESKNKIKGPLESWTQKQITPKLCKAAMASVTDWMTTLDTSDDEEHPLEVKISPNSTELVASISVDPGALPGTPEAAPVSIVISLPAAFPLQQAMVSSRNRVAVSERNWQSWLRTIRGIIMFSNGSLIDGLLAFRRNVQGALKGQTECAICYSIIGTDMKTPDKRCGTCKRLFHGGCLLRWFRSSSSSSCPLCRNNFSYA